MPHPCLAQLTRPVVCDSSRAVTGTCTGLRGSEQAPGEGAARTMLKRAR